MITIRATTFSKRKNSTARPRNFDESFSVVLKDSCSYDRPVFLLSEASFMYNYVEWSGWYYYVADVVVQRNNLVEVHCTLDSLATWRDAIRNSTQFVAYDTTKNTEISDRRLSTKTTTVRTENVGGAFDFIGSGFCVMINVVGERACCTYALTLQNATNLLNSLSNWADNLMPDVDIDDPPADWLTKIADSITKGFKQLMSSGSAADCIKSAYILPIDYYKILGYGENVMLGKFDTNIPAIRIANRALQDGTAVRIPWQKTDWRRNAPYTEIMLYVPFLGNISISPSAVMGAEEIIVLLSIDECSGDMVVTLSVAPPIAGAAAQVIGQYACNVSAEFAIGSSNLTPKQLATGAIAGVAAVAGTIATGGVAAVAAGTAGIAGEFNALSPLPSTIGNASGGALLALYGFTPRCMVIFHDTNVEPDSVSGIIGTPTMAVKSLSGLTGYVECRNAHVAIDGHDAVMDEIDNYLNGGVYLE